MEPTSPPHDYEYVVYPTLTNSLPPPNTTNSLGMVYNLFGNILEVMSQLILILLKEVQLVRKRSTW